MPRFTSAAIGTGVPNMMSWSSVAIIEPPQPSASAARDPWSIRFSMSWSTPIVVRCMISTTSRSTPRGSMPSFFQIACRLSGARLRNGIGPCWLPKTARQASPTSTAISLVGRSPIETPRSRASLSSLASSLISYPGTSPLAAAMNVSATPRPWSEWADVPAAIIRRKCRAAIVSPSAPQTPRLGSPPKGLMLHGPIMQCRQHRPVRPYPHCGCWVLYRSQDMET